MEFERLKDKVIVISGAVEGDLSALYDLGVTECYAATPSAIPLAEAFANAETYVAKAIAEALRRIDK